MYYSIETNITSGYGVSSMDSLGYILNVDAYLKGKFEAESALILPYEKVKRDTSYAFYSLHEGNTLLTDRIVKVANLKHDFYLFYTDYSRGDIIIEPLGYNEVEAREEFNRIINNEVSTSENTELLIYSSDLLVLASLDKYYILNGKEYRSNRDYSYEFINIEEQLAMN